MGRPAKEVDIPFNVVVRVGLVMLFVKVMKFLTKYPPFSFYWTDRLFHYRNRFLQVGIRKIEEQMRRLKLPAIVAYTENSDPYAVYHLQALKRTPYKLSRNKDIILESLAKVLNADKNFIYLRKSNKPKMWKLLVPFEYLFEEEA